MNDSKEDLFRFASEILTVHDELAPWIFDKNKKIYEHLRLRILNRADFMMKETISKIDGLERGDIVLLGSSASYFYRPSSDYDVKVEVINQNCAYLSKDIAKMENFLAVAGDEFYNRSKYFCIGTRFLDMKLAAYILDVAWTGVYSLSDNKWRIEPKNDLNKGFTASSLIEYYHHRCKEIDCFINSIPKTGEQYSYEECQKMFEYYRTQVLDKNQVIEDYFVFKMIKATGKLKEIGSFIFNQRMEFFKF